VGGEGGGREGEKWGGGGGREGEVDDGGQEWSVGAVGRTVCWGERQEREGKRWRGR